MKFKLCRLEINIFLPSDFAKDARERNTFVFAFYQPLVENFESPIRGSLRGCAWRTLVVKRASLVCNNVVVVGGGRLWLVGN